MKSLVHPPLGDITLHGVLHALGDPTRLEIVRNLYSAAGPLTCTEAVRGIDHLAVSTRSHCFRILREGGVIRSESKGRECYNTLRMEELERKFPKLLRTVLKQ
jgi:DNA-binding transcriptional ArsR family regulator